MSGAKTSATALSRVVALVLFLTGTSGCGGSGGIGCSVGGRTLSGPEVKLDIPADPTRKASIVVAGMPAEDLARLRRADTSREDWSAVLRVSVAKDQPAMLGDYTVTDHGIRFTPRFPFDPGRPYHFVLSTSGGGAEGTIGLPPSTAVPSTVVSHVYPSSDVVPENQLRMYIHFSAPMGLKGGLDYVKLVDQKGETVEDPFLPLDTEFWNDDRTRYTVFFDPGRQKRGIMPNQQMGRSLEPGKRYRLVVDRQWRDGQGLPLEESFTREFRVGPADERPLDPKSWRIAPPAAGSRDPLVVAFPEALDHGLLLRALGVAGPDGRPLPGDTSVDVGETRWRFTPRDPWTSGGHQLVALGMLEDLAGNRIGRAFEVDRFDRSDRSSEPDRTTIPVVIASR